MENGFFMRMCREAQDELASGEKGWRNAESNTLIMACFGIALNHVTHKVIKPLWFFASSVAIGVIVYIIISVVGI